LKKQKKGSAYNSPRKGSGRIGYAGLTNLGGGRKIHLIKRGKKS